MSRLKEIEKCINLALEAHGHSPPLDDMIYLVNLVKETEWGAAGKCPWCKAYQDVVQGMDGHTPNCPAFGEETKRA